jgi:hypothetical protein
MRFLPAYLLHARGIEPLVGSPLPILSGHFSRQSAQNHGNQ